MKAVFALMALVSLSAIASTDGVYHCVGEQYSTGKVYEVHATPIQISVRVNGEELLVVKQDKNCMVISESTFVSEIDDRVVIKRVAAFQNGCNDNDMLKNYVQLSMNMSASSRVAALFVTQDWKLTDEVIVYCK